MLDQPEKTRELVAALKAALPFEVAPMPDLIAHLAQQQKPVALNPRKPSRTSPTPAMKAASSVISVPLAPTACSSCH